jgi:hypothetical protein
MVPLRPKPRRSNANVSRGASQDCRCATEEVGSKTCRRCGIGEHVRSGPQEAETERRRPEGDYRSDKTALGCVTGGTQTVATTIAITGARYDRLRPRDDILVVGAFTKNHPTGATGDARVEAELLLHVVDASSPEAPHHTSHVLATLNEIGAAATPQILVLNKSELLGAEPDPAALARRILGDPQHQPAAAVAISAATGAGFERLLEKIDQVLALDPVSAAVFRFSVSDLASLNLLHENAQVTSIRYDEKGCDVEALVPESIKRRLKPYLASALPKAGPVE